MSKLLFASTIALVAGASALHAERVLFIESYHEGYAWSDGITRAVEDVIGAAGMELEVYHMDTKRNGSDEFKVQAAAEAKALIEAFGPDVVIATDDNAQKYLIAPNYVGSDLPVVFAGVNWDASAYGYPAANVTGMIEVSPTVELIELLTDLAGGTRVAYLAADTETQRKEVEYSADVLGIDWEPMLVSTYADWEAAFLDLQTRVDLIVLSPTAGINDFDAAAAQAFVAANATVPTGGYQEGTRDFALISVEKVAYEQGEWAANAALQILAGTAPGDIEVARNTQGYLVVNAVVAEGGGFEIPSDLLEAADLVVE